MNKIYIVACEMSMQCARAGLTDLRAGSNGLWANVGQTTRNVYERLRDDDYKRKQMGGELMVLFEQDVGDMTTDKQIHPLLKNHPDVIWNSKSSNTEEFFFKGDLGDGEVARKIVSEVLQKVCLPVLLQENARLAGDVTQLSEEITKRDEIISNISSGAAMQSAMSRVADTSKENDELKTENDLLHESLQQVKESFIFEQQAVNRIKEENRLLCKRNDHTLELLDSVESELNSLKHEVAEDQETLQHAIQTLQVTARAHQELKNELYAANIKSESWISQLQQEINSKTSDIIAANTKLDDAQQALDDAQQKLSSTQEYYNRQIKSVYASLEKEQKALTNTREDLHSTFETLNRWKMTSVLAGSLATILLSFAGWKLWESHDEISQLQSQFARQEEALVNETLKNNRLKLKLADASRPSGFRSAEQDLNHKVRQTTHPPTLLDPAEKKRYDELYSNLGKDRADAYAKRMAENDATTMGAARYAIQHSKPIDPDVNPDTAGVVILDAGVLVTLINEQVVSSATACLLLRSKSTSKYHVTAAMGILPDGHVGYVKVQDQTGDPQLVADCVLPVLKRVKIDPPDVNMLGTYTVDFNIKVADEQGG